MQKLMITIIGMIFLSFTFMALSCKKEADNDATDKQEKLKIEFQKALNSAKTSDPSLRSIYVRISIPDKGFYWDYAVGEAKPGINAKIGDQFMSASIGKVFTSLLILKLQEENLLQLDDSIGKYLTLTVTNGLSIYNSVDYSRKITIRQLLSHRSGLDDYFESGEINENGFTPFMQELIGNTEHLWTPTEIIDFYKVHFQSIAPPNDTFKYSDTNYQLLGLIAESVTGTQFNLLLWEKVLSPLQMNHTYMFGYDVPRPTGEDNISIAYFADLTLDFPAMRFDWAGGGLMTNCEDVENGMKAIVNNTFLSNNTQTEMMQWNQVQEGTYYGLGLTKLLYGYGTNEYLIGHEGTTGSFLFYSPKHGAYISGTINQFMSSTFIMNDILIVLEDNPL
jgi:CubicO group peptidase (beta-lactamase class C family)